MPVEVSGGGGGEGERGGRELGREEGRGKWHFKLLWG